MAAASDVPAFADHGMVLAGISEAAAGFAFTRPAPTIHQLLACAAGQGEVWVNGAWRTLAPGEAYFTPAATPHAYRARSRGSWQLCWVMYAPESRHTPRFAPTQPAVIAFNSRPLALAIEGLCEAVAHHGPPAERELWTRLIHRHVTAALAPTQTHDPRLTRLWTAVDADLAHSWSLAELAQRAALSREALRRACLRETGRSPQRELTHRRLRRAADLLRHTPDKIATIAARVGFADPFAFSTAFKRELNCPPRAFRNRK
ncbi:MAG: AraC family transcriptional regulator [Opitutaceae bacterium]|nr:AraC family transcriptional regulator [Opitutaceae bacterium]